MKFFGEQISFQKLEARGKPFVCSETYSRPAPFKRGSAQDVLGLSGSFQLGLSLVDTYSVAEVVKAAPIKFDLVRPLFPEVSPTGNSCQFEHALLHDTPYLQNDQL